MEYFNNSSKVHLVQTDGFFYRYYRQNIQYLDSQEAVLARLNPLDHLGQDYINIYLPALPCKDLILNTQSENSPFPIIIKSQTGIQGMKSGKRSAIIMNQEGPYIRLKGCGNLQQGFVVQNMAFPPQGRQIRGCCFQQTAIRQQYMCDIIDEILPQGYQTGNKPLGLWKYRVQNYNLVDKFCGLFYTLGEKRLGSHLIAGMKYLGNLLNTNIYQTIQKFKQERIQQNSLIPTFKFIKQTGPLNESLKDWTSQGVYKNNDDLINSLDLNLSDQIAQETPEALINLLRDQEIYWTGQRQIFEKLMKLAWKIGYQAGIIKRALQEHNICWGFFIDHNPFEPHCNAHPNNFIILPSSCLNVLSPVDFDMAFQIHQFINTQDQGRQDPQLFENWVNSERVMLQQALGGMENMANFQYQEGGENQTCMDVLISDQIVLGYRSGFEGVEDLYQIQRGEVEEIIRVSLYLTDRYDNY